MIQSVLPLRTTIVPDCVVPSRNPETIRELAFMIEDMALRDGEGINLERPAALYVRGALLDLADMIERYG